MKEELYIIVDGERHRLDLNTPSGITLEYVNNLFNDLSKIEASHSYTFKLPNTVNNSRLLECAEDVRAINSIWGLKLKAEYIYDGVRITSNESYMYISKAGDDGYSCVLTWGVYMALQELIDNDVNLPELRKEMKKRGMSTDELTISDGKLVSLADWDYQKGLTYQINQFNNTKAWVAPVYNAGRIITNWEWVYNLEGSEISPDFSSAVCFPKPVMPVYYLVQLINSIYGCNVKLGQSVNTALPSTGGAIKNEDIITYGVLPFTNSEVTDEQLELLGTKEIKDQEMTIWHTEYRNFSDVPYIPFKPESASTASLVFGNTRNNYKYNTINVIQTSSGAFSNLRLKIEGRLIVQRVSNYDYDSAIYVMDAIELDRASDWDDAVVAKMKPTGFTTYKNKTAAIYTFKEEYGYDPLKTDKGSGSYILAFKPQSGVFDTSHNRVYVEYFRVTPYYDCDDRPHDIDTITNLPDISSLDFVKSLFYLLGAFPSVNSNGEIVPQYWSDYFKDTVTIKDWSNKVVGDLADNFEVTPEIFSGIAKKNYWMSAYDDRDRTEREKNNEDRYEDGIRCIEFKNASVKKEADIYKFPYYPPYIRSKSIPSSSTGNTIKVWEGKRENGDDSALEELTTWTFGESKPAYGIVKGHATSIRVSSGTRKGDEFLSMEVVNPALYSNSYEALAEIVENALVLKINMNLSAVDLHAFDFSNKVFIERYNTAFIVSKITFSPTSGLSEVTLIAPRCSWSDSEIEASSSTTKTLTELTVILDPEEDSYEVYDQIDLNVIATFSDGSTSDVTSSVNVSIDKPTVIEIDDYNRKFMTLSEGYATVTISYTYLNVTKKCMFSVIVK